MQRDGTACIRRGYYLYYLRMLYYVLPIAYLRSSLARMHV